MKWLLQKCSSYVVLVPLFSLLLLITPLLLPGHDTWWNCSGCSREEEGWTHPRSILTCVCGRPWICSGEHCATARVHCELGGPLDEMLMPLHEEAVILFVHTAAATGRLYWPILIMTAMASGFLAQSFEGKFSPEGRFEFFRRADIAAVDLWIRQGARVYYLLEF